MTKEFECGAPNCTFLSRTEDEAEIVEHVRMHSETRHDRDVEEDRIRDRIRSV
jgi:predicted small metal-binding protein